MLSIELILQGKICPYCGADTEYLDSRSIYGKSHGMVYACLPCKAWVGVHKGTDKALGRLANEELRDCKKQTHALFDPLWKELLNRGIKLHEARLACYKWLSNALNIPFDLTHIGMFDVDQCKAACEAIKELLVGEGLQSILSHDETKKVLHPLNKKASVDIEQLSFEGRDKYFREVYDELEQFALKHDLELTALQFTQFRISGKNKVLDIYPVNRKYHNVKTIERGYYGYLPNFLNSFF